MTRQELEKGLSIFLMNRFGAHTHESPLVVRYLLTLTFALLNVGPMFELQGALKARLPEKYRAVCWRLDGKLEPIHLSQP